MSLMVEYCEGDCVTDFYLSDWLNSAWVSNLKIAVNPSERFREVYSAQCAKHFVWQKHNIYIRSPAEDFGSPSTSPAAQALKEDMNDWKSHSKNSDAEYPFVWDIEDYGGNRPLYRIIALQFLSGRTSHHYHEYTEEHFLSLGGTTSILLDGDRRELPKHKQLCVPPGTRHQLQSSQETLFQVPRWGLCVNLLLMVNSPGTFSNHVDHLPA